MPIRIIAQSFLLGYKFYMCALKRSRLLIILFIPSFAKFRHILELGRGLRHNILHNLMCSLKAFLQLIPLIASPDFTLIKCYMPYPHIINFMIIYGNVPTKTFYSCLTIILRFFV